MADLLIVASGTLSPLSTAGPVPSDGQPEWWRCQDCGSRTEDPARWGSTLCHGFVTDIFHDYVDPDGPFPFTVGVWQEMLTCPCGYWRSLDDDGRLDVGGCRWRKVGAVVALVDVTGPSHHAFECSYQKWISDPLRYCHPDAAPDGWRTPTANVRLLDTPVPCERPVARVSGYAAWGNVYEGPPRHEVWSADAETAVRLTEAGR